MPRVLITGAGGFIGWYATRALAQAGFDVHASALVRPDDFHPGITFHPYDLLAVGSAEDLIAAAKPSHLLHLAWNAQPGAFWKAPDNLDWVGASLRLYRAFVAAGGKRIVVAGSCAEYDWSHALLSEHTTPLNPHTLYGTCKHALHTMVGAAAKIDGVSLAWGRVFWLYGPREQPGRLVSDLARKLLDGCEAQCTEGSQRRDFMHVEDVARAFVQLLASDTEGPVNIASGTATPVAEVVSRVAGLTGRGDLVRMGALHSVPDDPPELVADVTTLHDVLGFRPRFSLQDGLEDTVTWLRTRASGMPRNP